MPSILLNDTIDTDLAVHREFLKACFTPYLGRVLLDCNTQGNSPNLIIIPCAPQLRLEL